jgi:hypothetical protein
MEKVNQGPDIEPMSFANSGGIYFDDTTIHV